MMASISTLSSGVASLRSFMRRSAWSSRSTADSALPSRCIIGSASRNTDAMKACTSSARAFSASAMRACQPATTAPPISATAMAAAALTASVLRAMNFFVRYHRLSRCASTGRELRWRSMSSSRACTVG